LHCDLRRLVAVEERRIDFDSFDFAGSYTEAEDDPVERLGIVAPSFPAVVPGSCVCENAWFADGRFGVVEVLCGGEPFVGEREDAGAEGAVDEVLNVLDWVVAAIIRIDG
jgi:hypothetical protein